MQFYQLLLTGLVLVLCTMPALLVPVKPLALSSGLSPGLQMWPEEDRKENQPLSEAPIDPAIVSTLLYI